MINSQHHPLFFYGTLRSQEVRHAVLSKLECSLNLVEGFVLGYDLFRVKNTNYPLILKNKQQRDDFLNESNLQGVMSRPAWILMNKLSMFEKAQCGDLINGAWLEDRIVNIPSSIFL